MVPLLDPIAMNSVTWDKNLRKTSVAPNNLLSSRSYYLQQEGVKLISKEIDSHNVATARLLHAGNAIELIHKKASKVTIVKTQSEINDHNTDYSIFHDYAGLSKFSEAKKTSDHILDNKLAYKNKGIWSSRSVSLEQLLKPVLLSKTVPYLELLGHLVTGNNNIICLVDTILVCSNSSESRNVNEINSFYQNEDISDVRYGFNHLSSYWSFAKETFLGKKQWYDKIDINHIVLSLINDNNDLETTQRIKLNGTNELLLKDDLVSSLLKSAKGFESALASKKRISSEGSFPTHAMLMATTVDGILHVRPLCTSGDVVLALHELLDVNIFSSGCIQLPSIVPTDFQRHTEGFYRYTYRLNQNGKWQYLMKKLPFGLQNLYHFIHPSYVDHKVVFDIQDLNETTDVPPCLKDSSIQIAKAVLAFYGKKKLVKTFHLDYEICFDKTKKLSKNSKSTRKTNIKTTFFPPHVHKEFCSLNCYIYRLLQITGMEFKECIATYRRDAILDLNPDVKIQNYLRNFELFFKDQWKQVLSETIRTTSTVNNVHSTNSNGQSSSSSSYIAVRSREENHASLSNKKSQDGSKLAASQLAQKLRLNYSLLIDETNPDISDSEVLDEIMSMDEDSDEDSFNAEDSILPPIIIDGTSSLEPKDTVFNFARQVISNDNLQQDVSKVNNNLNTKINAKISQSSIDYTPKPPISPIKKSNKSSRKKNVKLPTKVIPSFEDSYDSNNINESVDEKILRKFRYDEEKRIETEKRLHDEYVKAQQKAARMAAHAEAMRVAIKQDTTITTTNNNTIETISESQNEHIYSGENEERMNLTPNVHNSNVKRMSTYNSRSSQYGRDKRTLKNQAIDNDSSNEIYRKLIDKAGDDYLAENRNKGSVTSNDKIIAVDRRNFNARELYLFNNTINSPSKHATTPENLSTDLIKRSLEKDVEQVQNVDRNDVEYNKKAYQLAEMIDPSYLVSRFNGANHRSGKSIHLTNTEDISSSDDENQANEISNGVEIISNDFNCCTTNITTLQERKAIAKEKRKTLKRDAIERKEKLKKGAQDMLEQLLNKLPQHLASKIRFTLEKHELKKKKKLLKLQAKKNRMDLVVKSLKVEDRLQDSSSDSDTKKKIKRKVLTEKRKSMLKTNPDEVVDLVNDVLQTDDALSYNSSKSEKDSINKEIDLTDSDNPSNNSDVEEDADNDDDINRITNEIVCTDSSSNIDSTIIDIIYDQRVIVDLLNSMVNQIAETTGDDDDDDDDDDSINKDDNNDNKGLVLVQPDLQLKNDSNFTNENFNATTNPSVNAKTRVNDEDMVKINARAKRLSLQTTRKFSLMHLAKVMFDGNMMINNVQIDDITAARSLDDISCSIVEESTILDIRDLSNSRLTSPIISVRVSTAPKATVIVPNEPVFHYDQKNSFKEIISSLGLNSASASDYNESFASEYFQSEFIHKMEIREPKLGSLWDTPINNVIEYSEHVKDKALVTDDNNLQNLPEIEENNETFPTTIEINDLISEVNVNHNMSDSLLSRKTSVFNPNIDHINNLPVFLKPTKQIMKHKHIKLSRHRSNHNPNVNSKHEELHFKKIKEEVHSNKGLCLIIKNNKA